MSQTNALVNFSTRKQERLESGLADQISARTYNAVMCGTLLWGFLVNVLMVAFLAEPIMTWAIGLNPWVLFIGYVVLAFVGIIISAKSTNPLVSFLGFNLLVVPMGVMLCILVPGLPAAVTITASITAPLQQISSSYLMNSRSKR